MKSISKADRKERDRIEDGLNDSYMALETAVDEYNTEVTEAQGRLESARDEFNGYIQQAKEWSDGISERIQEYMDDKSEKWQEGERGELYSAWKSQYEDFSLEEYEPELPSDLDPPSMPENPLGELEDAVE